ncbi:unnamed protein product [Camellia sinensis]
MAIHPRSPLLLPSIFSLSVTVSRRRRERDGCEGVENPESIADHMYRMGLMALIASDRLLSNISIYEVW